MIEAKIGPSFKEKELKPCKPGMKKKTSTYNQNQAKKAGQTRKKMVSAPCELPVSLFADRRSRLCTVTDGQDAASCHGGSL